MERHGGLPTNTLYHVVPLTKASRWPQSWLIPVCNFMARSQNHPTSCSPNSWSPKLSEMVLEMFWNWALWQPSYPGVWLIHPWHRKLAETEHPNPSLRGSVNPIASGPAYCGHSSRTSVGANMLPPCWREGVFRKEEFQAVLAALQCRLQKPRLQMLYLELLSNFPESRSKTQNTYLN